MAKTFDGISDQLAGWLSAQPVFFVATAPLALEGLVNLSPKGMTGTFTIIDPMTVAYLDLTGSGIETVAHLRENGRIVVMFCAFSGGARIVRLHGTGVVVLPGEDGFDGLVAHFPDLPGARSVIRVDLKRVSDSCGYGVPRMTLQDERPDLVRWAERKGPDGIAAYQAEKNAESIDGLPGMTSPRVD